ncbi:Ankyrin repeat [Nesidiocoris tenuis]|uniref:Ankyrin repeat n=1 Tax=Nesidiocoris tenuis TaxID=355587 RepID=A0ABN7BFV8_9HEMI|nr:Ankyrin repeat [Nesidiocoris tenuis]
MDTDSPCQPGPSSSQSVFVGRPINPDAEFQPVEPVKFHLQPPSLSEGYEVLMQPYESHIAAGKQQTRVKKKMMHCFNKSPALFKLFYDERRLIRAASVNDEDLVRSLLGKGVNPSCQDNQLRTPLHVSACKGYVNIVRLLLENGANPHMRDPIGNTALHLAACTNNIDVVLLLLRAGTDACSSDLLGRSPLMLAQSRLKILLRAKFPDEEIKKQVSLVIDMLLHFSKYGKKSSDVEALDLELLSTFQRSVKLCETRHDIDAQVNNLLDNFGTLSIKTT